MSEQSQSMDRIQVRCIGCQAIGYVTKKYFFDGGKCPKCECALTDWVKVPGFKVTKALPKAADPFSRSYEHLEGDMKELNGTGTDYSGASRPRRLEDRNDFSEFKI